MRDNIDVTVWTDRNIGTATFGREFINELLSVASGRIAPEYFSLWEPINRSLANEGIEEAVKLWSEPNPLGGIFYLRRRSPPRLTIQVVKGPPLCYMGEKFPWSCGAWTSTLRAAPSIAQLFELLVQQFAPAYGECTLWTDLDDKHRFVIDYGRGTREFSRGATPGGDLIPGIYWLTYLGPWAIEILGRSKVESLSVGEIKQIGDGYLIKAFPSITQAGTKEAREAEGAIKSHFGSHLFFDRSKVDVEKLRQMLIDGTFDQIRDPLAWR